MRFLPASAGGLLLLLRRRSCSGPLLLGVAVCVFYQTLMVARNRLRSGQQQPAPDLRSRKPAGEVLTEEEVRKFISALEAVQSRAQVSLPVGAWLVVTRSQTESSRRRNFQFFSHKVCPLIRAEVY